MEVSEDIMKSRQSWFWRRVTLQATLAALVVFLGFEVYITAGRVLAWTDVAIIITLVSAITFLLSMYFAMVDNATKLSGVVSAIGDAVGDARSAQRDQ